MNLSSKIYVAGSSGMVGSAIVRKLKSYGYQNIITTSRPYLDLCCKSEVDAFFKFHRPEYVFMCAAKVGGIEANRRDRLGFLAENIQLQGNLFSACLEFYVEKVLFLGSSCIYPRDCPQPIKEEYLLSGPLESTNEGYALAKITGIKMAQYLYEEKGLKTICAMPCNLYGPGDNYDPLTSHVMAALIRKFVKAKRENHFSVEVWGDGLSLREFMHVEDAAEALIQMMNRYNEDGIINVGTGEEICIKELAFGISELVNYNGIINFDKTKPNGTPRKVLDISKMLKFYTPKISLKCGIERTIKDFFEQFERPL